MPMASSLKVADIIRANKQDIKIGSWESGPVPKAKFPLARNKLSLGRGWKWRVVTFTALQQQFVVLVAISEEKEYYRATLVVQSRHLVDRV